VEGGEQKQESQITRAFRTVMEEGSGDALIKNKALASDDARCEFPCTQRRIKPDQVKPPQILTSNREYLTDQDNEKRVNVLGRGLQFPFS
jgi:hypothetical protein